MGNFSQDLLNQKRRRIFYFPNHKSTVRTPNVLQRREFGDHKFTVFFHIFDTDFQDVIIVATDVKTFQHFV